MKTSVALFCCLQLALCLLTACSSTPLPAPPRLSSEIVEIPIVVKRQDELGIPPGKRVIIDRIQGEPCGQYVKDALMQRLVENSNYEVLSKDNLDAIIKETDLTGQGRFNTETTVRLGELKGASVSILGNIIRCGSVKPTERYKEDPATGEMVIDKLLPTWEILAVLQVLDLETRKVLVSSSSRGRYVQGAKAKLFGASASDPLDNDISDSNNLMTPESDQVLSKSERRALRKLEKKQAKARKKLEKLERKAQKKAAKQAKKRRRKNAASGQPSASTGGTTGPRMTAEGQDYPELKAAANLADNFAERFFARPTWVKVQMYRNPDWHFGESVRLVKLGRCTEAIGVFERRSSLEAYSMNERDLSEYLHNYGIALLCANRPVEAIEKLRSSYRISYEDSTMQMLSLAAKTIEWSLEIQPDLQPEIDMLVEREALLR